MSPLLKKTLVVVIAAGSSIIYPKTTHASRANTLHYNYSAITGLGQLDSPIIKTDARFIGGEEKWKKFLLQKCNPLVAARNKAPEGRYVATVRFMIHTDGTVSNVFILKDPGYGTGEELARIIKLSSKKWIPAVAGNDEKTIVSRLQSFTFVVSTATKN